MPRRILLTLLCLLLLARPAAAQQIVSLSVQAVTPTSFTLQWVTSVPSTTQIEYGPTSDYGLFTTNEVAFLLAHTQTVTGLVPGTLYHYRTKGSDGVTFIVSVDLTLSTPTTTPTAPPTISGVAIAGLSSQQANVLWQTDQPADQLVEYGLTTAYGATSTNSPVPPVGTTHEVTMLGLAVNTTYHYRVKSTNAFGTAVSADSLLFTPGPNGCHYLNDPFISELAAVYTPATSAAVLTWRTGTPADGQVEWGLTATYGALNPLDPTPDTTHTRSTSSLVPNQTYQFRVRSRVADPVSGTFITYCATGAIQTAVPIGPTGAPGPAGIAGPPGPVGPAGAAAVIPDPNAFTFDVRGATTRQILAPSLVKRELGGLVVKADARTDVTLVTGTGYDCSGSRTQMPFPVTIVPPAAAPLPEILIAPGRGVCLVISSNARVQGVGVVK